MSNVAEILKAVKRLRPTEQIDLAERVWDAVAADAPEAIELVQVAELDRRFDRIERDGIQKAEAMVVKVHLFALLRERAGVGALTLPLPEGATVEAAVDQLMRLYPAMQGVVSKICYAVNQDYANAATSLHDGDELALIPPVSGG